MIKKILSAAKSKDGKALIENFSSLSLLKIASYSFPLITLPYLARVIDVDKFGELAFARSIIIFFQTLVDYGFNYTGVRDIAKNRNDIEKVSKIFCTIMYARLYLMLVSFILLVIFIFLFPLFYENRLILFLTFLIIPGYTLFPDWFFQAIEQMKFITIMNLISQLLFTILVFVIIKEKNDYIYQPILIFLGSFVSGIIAFIIIIKKFNVKIIIPTISDVIFALKESRDMFISLFLPNLYSNFSTILLRSYGGEIATGVFSGGQRFVNIVDQFSMILSRTFYPFLARRVDQHSVYVKISLTISLIAGLFLFFGSDLLVSIFYTENFKESATVIKIMAVSPFFLTLMNTYGPNYLVLVNRMDILRNIILICSVFGFILSWMIIPKYGYIGASLTLPIVWGVRGYLTWFYASGLKK